MEPRLLFEFGVRRPAVALSPRYSIERPVVTKRRQAAALQNVSLYFQLNNLNTASVDQNTGQIINSGDFGRITSTSNNARLIQVALKLNF